MQTIEQYDRAIMEKLQGLVIDDVPVEVLYVSQEKESRESKLPCFTIHRAGAYPDMYRWQNDVIYDNEVYDIDGNLESVDVRERPHPYLFYYGIRINYEYQEDGMLMTQHLHKALKRGTTITLDGYSFDVEFVSYKNPSATYKDFGEFKAKDRREFSEQYLFKVLGALDFTERVTHQVVTKGVDTSINTI